MANGLRDGDSSDDKYYFDNLIYFVFGAMITSVLIVFISLADTRPIQSTTTPMMISNEVYQIAWGIWRLEQMITGTPMIDYQIEPMRDIQKESVRRINTMNKELIELMSKIDTRHGQNDDHRISFLEAAAFRKIII
ncbi:hypothetical protein PENTCL1PPCAC_10748 [Pristionchus entomophagus]|uniref:Uncharacterized protein n=1 Tax=Pristionchus entomophagus TaxID=358040 RepID=A0AAV5T6W5_9BILA|nr:hypothetical protein PENTCL1PPCAC_10748 [Pristionchus entomophagus]